MKNWMFTHLSPFYLPCSRKSFLLYINYSTQSEIESKHDYIVKTEKVS